MVRVRVRVGGLGCHHQHKTVDRHSRPHGKARSIMEKQKLSPKSIINIIRGVIILFVLLICILSPLAFFIAYFMFKNSVNATTEFFLRWTCASILTVTIRVLLQFIASLMGANDFPAEKRILVVFVAAIGQSLIMTYLFATYQPGPDQISQIYAFSWILVIAVIHALWALEDGTDQSGVESIL